MKCDESKPSGFRLLALPVGGRFCHGCILLGEFPTTAEAFRSVRRRGPGRFARFPHRVSGCRGHEVGVARWSGGICYWFFPSLAFVWLLLFGLRSGGEILKAISVLLMVMMCFGVVRDWRTHPLADLHWAENARHIENATPGTVIVIPINTPGWTMQLVEHWDRSNKPSSSTPQLLAPALLVRH